MRTHIRAKPPKRRKISPVPAQPNLAAKRALLDNHLRGLGRTLVAYSGGVDSAFLACAAHQVLGSHMLAVIADSPSLARTRLADATAFAAEQEIPLEVIVTSELDRPEYARNDAARCFHCKDELFTTMEEFRSRRGFDSIAYGVNLDDQGDFRPGQRAAEQHRVAAPLRDTRPTKQDIRAASVGRAPARHRTNQAGQPGTVPRRWAARLGQTGFGLPVFTHRIRT